jgi:sporulation protein YunB
MRYDRKGLIKRKLVLLLVFLLLICLAFISLIDWLVRPMIQTYGNNQAATAATRAVNDAVESVLSKQDIDYNNLSNVIRDESGKIVSIHTNTANINIVKSAVSKAILNELDNQKFQDVEIPMGSLAGGLLTGRGPTITIKVPMNSTVETDIENKFEGAGINQTKHEISLKVKVTIYTVIQGKSSENEITTGFTVAENILVGEVPNWLIKGTT